MAPTNDSLDMGPPSPCPDIRGMKHTAAVEAMVAWFLANFEDPQNGRHGMKANTSSSGGPLLRARRARAHLWRRRDRSCHRCRCHPHRGGRMMWVPSGSRMQECD